MRNRWLLAAIFTSVFFLFSCASTGNGIKTVPRSVERYMQKNGSDFDSYKLSDLREAEKYNFYEHSYSVYEDIDTVWHDYLRSAPDRAFDSPIIDFGVVFDPDDAVLYRAGDRKLPPFHEGQIFLLNLNFLRFFGVPVGFEISRIDSEKKIIEFVYLKNNISNGFQRIFLKSESDKDGNPVTRIRHVSFFKTANFLRDKLIYPPFHRHTIDNFHENIFKMNGLSWEY